MSVLPPTCVENAEFDVRRASGERFVEQLDAAAATFDVLAAQPTEPER